MELIKSYYSKINGNTFIPNGQLLLQKLEKNEKIFPEREPDNKFDKNAVALFNKEGNKLGYVPATTAVDLSSCIDQGNKIEIKVSEITEGNNGKNIGCNIHVSIYAEVDDTYSGEPETYNK